MSFHTQYVTLSPTDASNRYIVLDGTPVSAVDVALDTISGTAQALNYDFYVDGTSMRWDGSTAYHMGDATLIAGDMLRIIYDRS